MPIQASITNAASTAASLFAKLLLAAAVIFALLLLSIHFGWSALAGVIFTIAGFATSALCFFADSIKGLFGKGRAVGLGIISLYLSLMSTLAYAAPDFFSGLGIGGWVGLTTIFFAATTGGSVALISFEKASKVVAVLVILLIGFGLISGHVFARGVQYLASNAASALGRKAYSMGAGFEDSEGDIKVKYRAEYQVKKAALEKEWESGKITASVYEEKRKALDKEYERALKPEPTVVQAAPPPTPPSSHPSNTDEASQKQQSQPSHDANIGASLDKWVVDVSAINAKGVPTELPGSRYFTVAAGDEIEIQVTGFVKVGADRPAVGPAGETSGYWDYSVDSPFHHNVGGLEMWFGSDKHANRYLVGSQFRQKVKDSGIITFRVIDSLTGYKGTGSFHVTVRKIDQ